MAEKNLEEMREAVEAIREKMAAAAMVSRMEATASRISSSVFSAIQLSPPPYIWRAHRR